MKSLWRNQNENNMVSTVAKSKVVALHAQIMIHLLVKNTIFLETFQKRQRTPKLEV